MDTVLEAQATEAKINRGIVSGKTASAEEANVDIIYSIDRKMQDLIQYIKK